jgi:hypothetical protein
MKHPLFWVLLFVVLIGCTFGVAAQQKSLVASLKNSSVADGCGCYFSLNKSNQKANRLIYFDDSNKNVWMNIEGRDVKLQLVTETTPPKKLKLGTRLRSSYEAGDIHVDVVQTVTWLCPRKDEACEDTKYSVVLSVRKGTRSQTDHAVGECGC